MKFIAGILAGIVLAVGGPVLASSSVENPENPPRWMTSPCQSEDSTNCFWDATVQGNGKGRSFYAIRVDKKTCIVYWHNRYARKHNRCYKS